MPIKTFTVSDVLTASDTNTYLANSGLVSIQPTSVTNGTVTGNIVTFTNVASVTLNGIFTTAYSQYRLVITATNVAGTSAYSRFQTTIAGTAQTTSYASKSMWTNMSVASVVWQDYDAPSNAISIGPTGTGTYPSLATIDVAFPASATQSYFTGTFAGTQVGVANYMGMIGGVWQSATAFDGIKLFAATGQNISGEIRVLGYR
jgi:hypothetical protein